MKISQRFFSIVLALIFIFVAFFGETPIIALSIPGDINGDGYVNNKDITRLFQYLSEWDVDVNENALDINADGDINNKDLTRLFQYLSDWDVEIYDNKSILQSILEKMPSYFKGHYQTECGISDSTYIDSKVSSVPKGQSFVFVTDMHYPENNNNSYYPMLYAYKKLGLNTVIHGGDVLDYDHSDKNAGISTLKEWTNNMRSCFGKNMLPVLGNHDCNWAGMSFATASEEEKEATIIPYSDVETIFLDGCRNHIVQEADSVILERMQSFGMPIHSMSNKDIQEFIAWYKLHYYYDDKEHKTRHIIVNSVGYSPLLHKYFYAGENKVYRAVELLLQIDWLYETLLSAPDDYNIVVTGHSIIDYQTNSVSVAPQNTAINGITAMLRVLSLAKQNASDTLKLLSGVSAGNPTYKNKTFDFTSKNRTGKIFCLCGHAHWDYSCVFHEVGGEWKSETYTDNSIPTNDGILIIMTQTDAIRGANYTKEQRPGYPWDSLIQSPMIANTVTEQCFDIVTVTNSGIVCTRIGAGSNRYYQY